MKYVKKTTPILIAMLISLHFSVAQDLSAFEKKTFTDGANSLPFCLLSPQIDGKNKKYPLIIFLHGSGERGEDNESQLKNCAYKFLEEDIRKKYPAYVVFPQCPKGQRWSELNDGGEAERYFLDPEPSKPMELLTKLISQLENNLSVDSKRIYVMGLSMGGQGVYDLMIRKPLKFAAAVAICGASDTRQASALTQTPVWIFHGEEDEVVPVDLSRVMNRAIEYAGGSPKYTEYAGVGHNSWDNAIEEPKLFSWLFSKKRR